MKRINDPHPASHPSLPPTCVAQRDGAVLAHAVDVVLQVGEPQGVQLFQHLAGLLGEGRYAAAAGQARRISHLHVWEGRGVGEFGGEGKELRT